MLVAIAMAFAAPSTAIAKDQYIYGPEPDWDRYKVVAEAAMRARLPDPDNYTLSWPNGYMQYHWDHKGSFYGYLTCGEMRTLTPVKDRHPLTNFIIVIERDEVKTIDISGREGNSLVNITCQNFVRKGQLPPAKLMEVPKDLTIATLGAKIRIMPEGAYVIQTVPGSLAARAAVAPGMVITRVNGIALAGTGTAMAKVLESDASALTLETAAGELILLKRAPQ